ncbi:MAG: hypothetical protein SFT81_06230 [Candidatus Caenarcaniphilales bacterium]|nr:hypothetical protein [Candidatus Caenarcaniphilales bacterium]
MSWFVEKMKVFFWEKFLQTSSNFNLKKENLEIPSQDIQKTEQSPVADLEESLEAQSPTQKSSEFNLELTLESLPSSRKFMSLIHSVNDSGVYTLSDLQKLKKIEIEEIFQKSTLTSNKYRTNDFFIKKSKFFAALWNHRYRPIWH